MADTRTPEQRRRIMQAVKTEDTGPELIARRILHRLGFRYRLFAASCVQVVVRLPPLIVTTLVCRFSRASRPEWQGHCSGR